MRKVVSTIGLVLLALSAIVFWGSIYSILVAYAMILMVPGIAMVKYFNSDKGDDYFGDQNG